MAMYGDKGAGKGGPAKTFLTQHLHEVAIDHSNGIFAGTNNYIASDGMDLRAILERGRCEKLRHSESAAYFTPSRSTSNISVAPGGMSPPAPLAP
jgi:hypothetical protein